MRTLPVLLTYDVHTHAAHAAPDVDRYLQYTLELHARMGVKASFFFPAEAARSMKQTVASLVREGHGVGCHGLTHRNEYYKLMPAAAQKEKLTQATRELEDITQQRMTFFRAPAFKISGTTIRVLEELGYEADLSMNSQRLGLLSSDVWNVSWMFAPRGPYHPDLDRPWRRGNSQLWEIPLSCMLVPFMINTGQVFGLGAMRGLFRTLRLEARHGKRPVVYMVHPEDLCAWGPRPQRPVARWRDLLPSRDRGFACRHWVYETDPVRVARLAQGLFKYMLEDPIASFMTVPEYVAGLRGAERMPAEGAASRRPRGHG